MHNDPPLYRFSDTARMGARGSLAPRLSDAATSVWAKSSESDGWLPLHIHLADTAAVAAFLWDEWLPAHVKGILAHDLEDDLIAARRRLIFLASTHDLGKVTPAFAVQVPVLAETMRDSGFSFRLKQFDPDRQLLPHSLAGYFLLERWLRENCDWDRDVARSYAVVVGSHHGVTPTRADVRQSPQPHLIGEGEPWRAVQEEFIHYAISLAGVVEDFDSWGSKAMPVQAQVLLTAVVIIADWLASDEKRFPYGEHKPSPDRARRAWQELQLTPAWRAIEPQELADDIIRSRFSLPEGSMARPVQRAAIDVARSLEKPGLMIIEAPMGEGKTEAALACAEILAARFGLGGCFIALPTMATSDAMFARVQTWIKNLPRDPGESTSKQSLFLAHSKASLNEEFADLASVGRLKGMGDDQGKGEIPEEVLEAHSWLVGRKKGPLSNFVVGTIDQVLFGGLRSRHLMLRHLSLVNKVVVIDEVHSYDSYMNVYLDRILGWLGEYGVPVIMLSATLPSSRRGALAEAYEHGAESRILRENMPASMAEIAAARRRMRQQPIEEERASKRYPALQGELGYPVITATTPAEPIVTPVVGSSRAQEVRLKRLDDDDASLIATLEASLVDGGCAVVIRNTVGRAQQTMRLLEKHFGVDVELTLSHSRFVASDRMKLDSTLRSTFGPPSGITKRPDKAIVVGTQVLEQSLDIDFDVMITDLAPMDLLLQRIGRLHRHEREKRPTGVTSARCFITGVHDWTSSPPTAVRAAQLIYGPYLLLRTLWVLEGVFDRGGAVQLPVEIPTLVEQAYDDFDEVPERWRQELDAARQRWQLKVEGKEMSARSYLLGPVAPVGGSIVDWVSRGAGEANDDSAEGQAQVRDTEDSVEVLVVQRANGQLRTLPGPASDEGLLVPEESEPSDRVARVVANSSIRLPYSLCAPWRIDGVVSGLEQNAFTGWQRSRWLKGQLVLVLDSELQAALGEFTVRYDRKIGLTVIDEKDPFHG